MRHLFDTRKEHKSIKLVKKLQEEADKEWENEITRRREQELNDEAIAKELQAQLEQESSAGNNGSNHTNSPPPLPTKPRAYNSSINISNHAAASSSSISSPTNCSTNSLLTTSTSPTSSTSPFATKPLYSISSSNNKNSQPALPPRDQNTSSKKPVKSYLADNERYKPELQFALASPAPCPSSVFYQKTPMITPAITPLKALDTSTTTNSVNNSSASSTFYNGSKTPTSSNGMPSSRPAPVTVQPQPTQPTSRPASTQPIMNRMEMPMPTDMNPTHYQSISTNSAPSSYNNHHHQASVTSPTQNTPYQPPPYAPHNSDPIVLPLSQPTPPPSSQQQQHYPPALIPVAPTNSPLYPQQQQQQQQQQQNDANTYFPPAPPQQQQQQHYPYQPMRQSTSSPAISLPLNSNGIYQQANYSQPQQQQQQQQSPSAQQSSYSFNSVYQATPPPPPPPQQQQSYASVKPPLVSTASSNGFQLPPMPVLASSSSSSNVTAKPQPQSQAQQRQKSTLAPTNPYYKKQDEPQLSTSTISLKPDEEQPKKHMDQDLLGFDGDDDEDDDWDIVRPTKTLRRPPTPIPSNTDINEEKEEEEEEEEDEDDRESAIDYSDMIYHSGEKVQEEKEKKHVHSDHEEEETEEEDWEDTAIDPFDDDFAVHVPKGSKATSATVMGDFRKKRASSVVTTLTPTFQILDPTIVRTTTSPVASPIASAAEEEERIIVQKRKPKQDKTEKDTTPRQYVEKESEEIEHRPTTPHIHRSSIGSYLPSSVAATPAPSFYSPSPAPPHPSQQQQLSYYNRPQSTPLIELDLPEDEQSKVYPTNILKAGAPPGASASQMQQQQQQAANPYFKKQGIVPATDYGYFKEGDQLANKSLPKLPPSATSDDDRHITVSSINPGQRVWIRIHPTDTGKDLAERIHIVASYQTRRVTKITTKQGRQISLDSKPLFEDWNEIINFKEGEQWTVEWVPIEHPYVDIITEGKEFMKQLKANFRGSSSK